MSHLGRKEEYEKDLLHASDLKLKNSNNNILLMSLKR